MIVERIDRQVDREQYDAARAGIAEALEAADRTTRWRLKLRRAELGFASEEEAIDEALLVLDDLLSEGRAGAYGPELARAHAARVRAFGIKRCPVLAQEAADAAGEVPEVANDPRLLVARGRVCLFNDERAEAGELFRRALELAPHHAGARFELANLLYVLADFDACHTELDGLPPEGRYALRAARLRAACYGAVQDDAREIEVWRTLNEAGAESDFHPSDRLGLALTLACAGQREEALELLREVWRADPDTTRGRYVRRRIEHLEAAGPDAARRQLKAFPTTYQKWNYCGPAVLELCLRYLGLELDQEEIAKAVKREGGTPMYEIVAFLRELGIEARRIEATGPRLRAAIDLGLPVILQEEYSTASHVAVITGYDEGLGLFVSQDPSGHRPRLKSFEWTADSGQLYGNGGVVVLGRAGEELSDLLQQADEAGLVTARHLELLDACDRERPSALGEGNESVAGDEVIRLCDEAIALCPEFKLAYYRRFGALASKSHEGVAAELFRIRTRFPHDSWPHDLHGRWLYYEQDRYEEAFVELGETFRRDPQDARARELMGEAKWLSGDLERAETDLLHALALEPFRVRPAENLAAVYLRQLMDRDDDTSPQRCEGRVMAPSRVRTYTPRAKGELLERALHFNRVGLASHPENPFDHVVQAELLARCGDLAGAVAGYRQALELQPQRVSCLWGLADLLELQGAHEEAEALYVRSAEAGPRVPTYRLWAEFLRRRERHEDALKILLEGVAQVEGERHRLLTPLADALEDTHAGQAGASELRAIAERFAGDPDFLRAVAELLRDREWRDDAVALLRHIVNEAPHDVGSLNSLARLLLRDGPTRDEGRQLMERVRELAPYAVGPRCELAWLLLPEDPQAGLDLLKPILETQDSGALDTQSALFAAMGREGRASRSFRLALESEGDPSQGLLRICEWHLGNGRYERVYELVGRIRGLGLDDFSLWSEKMCEAERAVREKALAEWPAGSREAEGVDRALAHSLVGELWHLVGKPLAAKTALDVALKTLERLPTQPTVKRAMAEVLARRAPARASFGEVEEGVEDLARAADLYTSLVPADPDRAENLIEVLYTQAGLLWKQDEAQRARAALDLACAVEAPAGASLQLVEGLADSRADALQLRARVRAHSDGAGAVADAREALSLVEGPTLGEDLADALLDDVVEATLLLAGILEGEMQLTEAQEVLEALRDRLEPLLGEGGIAEHSTRVAHDLAGVLWKAGAATEARETCQRLIDALEAGEAPDKSVLSEAYHSLGVICLDLLSDPRAAIPALTRAIELTGARPSVLANRAYAALRLLHPERALTDGDAALEFMNRYFQPGDERPHWARSDEGFALRSIACAYELLGEVDEGLAAGERSLELFDSVAEDTDVTSFAAEVRSTIARLLLTRGDVPRARELSEHALGVISALIERGNNQSDMDLVKALRTQAAVLRAAGEPAPALAALDQAEEIALRWVALGGAFHDVLADVERLRGEVHHDAHNPSESSAAFARGREGLSQAIQGGLSYMLPELLSLTRAELSCHSSDADAVLASVLQVSQGAVADAEAWTRTSLVARRRDLLLATLEELNLQVDAATLSGLRALR
jgi:tetratricopeptide (TPR) repeat protein